MTTMAETLRERAERIAMTTEDAGATDIIRELVSTLPAENYNGWKNYPTWAVNLWLDNDESTYREALSRVAAIAADAPYTPNVADGTWTLEQAIRYDVADNFKEWVTDDLSPDLGASFAADLLGYALGEVNWEEIADAWIESFYQS